MSFNVVCVCERKVIRQNKSSRLASRSVLSRSRDDHGSEELSVRDSLSDASPSLDGSDAMNRRARYSAAYSILDNPDCARWTRRPRHDVTIGRGTK